ncbi:energy-coupling factor ABC transporter permease [Glaciecola sp. XM2]|uniref:energy-coupling factor ABC transporter permease n=1 Tax=Glaciecola sp. XM2 TaxID=1914931 RepID=UPI001BDF6087|nr:energy-coupling factor ABC transporter permease [Glaciecola sp. XM2]MBT1449739.1 energy-coupling factor ABC transporter permease [Glaciecola sp. XM2]
MSALQIISVVLYVGIVAYVISKTPLKQMLQDKGFQHRLFGSMTCVFVLWLFRVSIYDGLVMHFLWLTALTLVLGFRWAIIAATVVLIGSTIIGQEPLAMFGVNGLLGVLLPVAFTYMVFMLTFHKLPRHLFTYIFLCAFFPGAITMALKMLSLSAYFYADGMYAWNVIEYNYAQMTILMMFPEAFFNGMTMTCLIVYKPELVYTFEDKFYLDGK